MDSPLKTNPLVSVVLPVYNCEKYIKEAVTSVLEQTYSNLEIIIIDDCSTDKTSEILHSFKDERLIIARNEENLKIAKSLNKGMSLATGKYIARMDADDICHPTRFEKQVAFLEENKDTDILGTNIVFIDDKSKVQGKFVSLPTGKHLTKFLLSRMSVIAHPTVMMRASVRNDFEDLYKENYPHAEDYELWLRLSKKFNISNLNDYLLWYRIHPNSITQKNYSLAIDSMHRAIEEHNPLKLDEIDPQVMRFIRKPQGIKTKSDHLKVLNVWAEAIDKLQSENELTRTEELQLLKWHHVFFLLTMIHTLINLRQIHFAAIKLFMSQKRFAWRVIGGLFVDSFFIFYHKSYRLLMPHKIYPKSLLSKKA